MIVLTDCSHQGDLAEQVVQQVTYDDRKVVLQKSERNAVGVKSHFPVQLRRVLTT